MSSTALPQWQLYSNQGNRIRGQLQTLNSISSAPNKQITPTVAQINSAAIVYNKIMALPSVLPRIFTVLGSDNFAVDVRVGESYPQGLKQPDWWVFGRYVNRRVGQIISGEKRSLIKGTSWLQGVRNIGGESATLRVFFETSEDEAQQAEIIDFIKELTKGIEVTISEKTYPVSVVHAPPIDLLDCCIIRISNINVELLKAGMGSIFFEELISKFDGFQNATFRYEFLLPNIDWGFTDMVPDMRSFYIALKGVDSLVLVGNYIQFKVSATDVFNLSQMPANYTKILSELSNDIKLNVWDILPEIQVLDEATVSRQEQEQATDGLLRIGTKVVLPNVKPSLQQADSSNGTVPNTVVAGPSGQQQGPSIIPPSKSKTNITKKPAATSYPKITLKRGKSDIKLPTIKPTVELILNYKVKAKFQAAKGKKKKDWTDFIDAGLFFSAANGVSQEEGMYKALNSITRVVTFAEEFCQLDSSLKDITRVATTEDETMKE